MGDYLCEDVEDVGHHRMRLQVRQQNAGDEDDGEDGAEGDEVAHIQVHGTIEDLAQAKRAKVECIGIRSWTGRRGRKGWWKRHFHYTAASGWGTGSDLLEGAARFLDETRPGMPQRESPPATAPAVVVTRGDIVESQHTVWYALVDSRGKVLASEGDVERPVYLRSSAKPMIAAAVVASGAADRFGFSPEELAIAAGSHGGEPRHVAAVESMLRKAGLSPSALRCGVHAPSHGPSAEALCAAGRLPEPIHNNCSGKHAAILALAVHLGADPGGYLEPDHPAQQAILAACARFLDLRVEDFTIGVDGCGIPVIATGLARAARFYARLATCSSFGEPLGGAMERIRDAMIAHPYYVAGSGRFDTDLMTVTRPALLAKGGAEGYHGSAALARGLGLSVKVADGNYRAVAPFVVGRWRERGILTPDHLASLSRHVRPVVRNYAGRVVGEIRDVYGAAQAGDSQVPA
jgi:L-asparaginase II